MTDELWPQTHIMVPLLLIGPSLRIHVVNIYRHFSPSIYIFFINYITY